MEKVFCIVPENPNVTWRVQLINKTRQCESLNSRAAVASGLVLKCLVSNILYWILNVKNEHECNLSVESDSLLIIYCFLA